MHSPSHVKQLIGQQLSMQFDTLFATTRAKKQALVLVLDHPFLPLHNNGSELGARSQARIRNINFQTVSPNGTKSKDMFATITLIAIYKNNFCMDCDIMSKNRSGL